MVKAVMYSRESCEPCKSLKEKLEKRGVEVEEIKLSEDEATKIGIYLVPTTKICGSKIIGDITDDKLVEILGGCEE